MRAAAQHAAGGSRRFHPVGVAGAAVLVFALAALGLPRPAIAAWPLYGHDLANSRVVAIRGTQHELMRVLDVLEQLLEFSHAHLDPSDADASWFLSPLR